jgi:hypothetical protein
MLGRVALLRTDVSEERIVSMMKVARIRELGTALALSSNRSKLGRNNSSTRATRRKVPEDSMLPELEGS